MKAFLAVLLLLVGVRAPAAAQEDRWVQVTSVLPQTITSIDQTRVAFAEGEDRIYRVWKRWRHEVVKALPDGSGRWDSVIYLVELDCGLKRDRTVGFTMYLNGAEVLSNFNAPAAGHQWNEVRPETAQEKELEAMCVYLERNFRPASPSSPSTLEPERGPR